MRVLAHAPAAPYRREEAQPCPPARWPGGGLSLTKGRARLSRHGLSYCGAVLRTAVGHKTGHLSVRAYDLGKPLCLLCAEAGWLILVNAWLRLERAYLKTRLFLRV